MSHRSRGQTVATIWPQLQVSTVKTAMLLRTIHGVDPVWIGAISAVGGASATGLFSWLKSIADKGVGNVRPKPNTHTWRKRRAGFDAGPTKVLLLMQAHGCETHRGSVLTLLGTGLGAIRGSGCTCSPAPVSHLSTECAGSAGDATDGRDNP